MSEYAPAVFLKQRLDEDEAVAVAWGRGSWEVRGYDVWVPGAQVYPLLETSQAVLAAHIARHDPFRVLRDVEAGRKLLRLHAEAAEVAAPAVVEVIEGIICDRAAVWSDHPDFRAGWLP